MGSPEVNTTGGVINLLIAFFFLGSIARSHFIKRTKIPYTVVMLVFGMILGIAHNKIENWSEGTLAVTAWTTMDPHLLLYVFLPPLIFSSAFDTDFHIFRRAFFQILVIA